MLQKKCTVLQKFNYIVDLCIPVDMPVIFEGMHVFCKIIMMLRSGKAVLQVKLGHLINCKYYRNMHTIVEASEI
jgi:hypothetical protein